jgi:hypothetical protein
VDVHRSIAIVGDEAKLRRLGAIAVAIDPAETT